MSARPFRLKPQVPLERDIQAAVLSYLQHDRRVALAGRINSGAHVAGEGRDRRFIRYHTLRGCPDILGMLRGGTLLAVEVKRPGQHPTEDQAAFLERVREAGGCAAVVRSIEDARRALDEFCQERELGQW